jgi:hypothetical protein
MGALFRLGLSAAISYCRLAANATVDHAAPAWLARR